MTDPGCNAGSPDVVRGAEMRSYTCELPAQHDGYHRNEVDGPVIWRDPESILGEPHPWHPNHRPHQERTEGDEHRG